MYGKDCWNTGIPLNKCIFLLLLVLLPNVANAIESVGLLTIGYGDPANVSADLDEEEINPDQYPEYDLDPGKVLMARWIGKGVPLMIRYNAIDTIDDRGVVSNYKYQSLVLGLAYVGQAHFNRMVGVYSAITAGVGAARFSVAGVATEALFDCGIEAGVIVFRRVSLGIGGSLQIAGYPGETVATALIPTANLSVWY